MRDPGERRRRPGGVEVLLIGGRSGVGKSAVAGEVSAQLAAWAISHVLIEGDLLDLAYPPPRAPTRSSDWLE